MSEIKEGQENPREQFLKDMAEANDPEIADAGYERRKTHVRVERTADYTDKGQHDWYLIGPYAYKCSKCKCIKDVLFKNPVYLPRPTVKLQSEPACTWRGRKSQ